MKPAFQVRVGIVMPLAEQRGGAEIALLHFLDGLPTSQRDSVHLCFLEPGPMAEQCRRRGYDTVVIPAGRLRQPLRWLRCVRELRRWLRSHQMQVVVSWLAKAHLYAGPAARLARIPAVWWQHGLPTNWSVDAIATLLPSRCVLTCSQAAAAAQRSVLGHRAELRTINPPVDLEAVRRIAARPVDRGTLDLPADRLIIGIVARLQRWKGVHVLLQAAAAMPRGADGPVFVVVGGTHALESDYATEVRRLAAALGLGDRVVFAGHQSNPLEWMAAMDIVVNASFGEPFGLVIIEALALGRAVVATRQAGPTEIIADGVNGLLVPPGDSAELASALQRLRLDPALRAALGAAGRERANMYGVAGFVTGLSTALREVAAT